MSWSGLAKATAIGGAAGLVGGAAGFGGSHLGGDGAGGAVLGAVGGTAGGSAGGSAVQLAFGDQLDPTTVALSAGFGLAGSFGSMGMTAALTPSPGQSSAAASGGGGQGDLQAWGKSLMADVKAMPDRRLACNGCGTGGAANDYNTGNSHGGAAPDWSPPDPNPKATMEALASAASVHIPLARVANAIKALWTARVSTKAASAVPVVTRAGAILSTAEVRGLTTLFQTSVRGADDLLARLQAGATVKLPPGVTRETLVKYRELATRAIGAGKDTIGVQAKRMEIIDTILKGL